MYQDSAGAQDWLDIQTHWVIKTDQVPIHSLCSGLAMINNTPVHRTDEVYEHTDCTGLVK